MSPITENNLDFFVHGFSLENLMDVFNQKVEIFTSAIVLVIPSLINLWYRIQLTSSEIQTIHFLVSK